MAPQERLHQALAKPQTVAYLLAHAEWLTGKGVFKGRQTARTVFFHLCSHPGPNLPGEDREPTWHCPVDMDHYKPGDIAKATGIDASNVRTALDWLDAELLIDVKRTSADPKAQARRKAGATPRMGYGPVTILSTNWLSDQDRLHEKTRRKLTQRRSAPNHHVPPAEGHSALIKGTAPLIDGTEAPAAPSRPRRTVAGKRPTSANAGGLGQSATLRPEPPGRRPSAGARSEVGAPAGCGHAEAGLHTADDTTDSSIIKSSTTRVLPSYSRSHGSDPTVARTSGRKPTERGSARGRACRDDSLTDVVLPGISAAGLEDSPGYRAGDDQAARDLFRLYYDTGDRQHRPVTVA
jgi:hypothetical protein